MGLIIMEFLFYIVFHSSFIEIFLSERAIYKGIHSYFCLWKILFCELWDGVAFHVRNVSLSRTLQSRANCDLDMEVKAEFSPALNVFEPDSNQQRWRGLAIQVSSYYIQRRVGYASTTTWGKLTDSRGCWHVESIQYPRGIPFTRQEFIPLAL